MSGQCLSASGAGRALTPARHLRLGGPLPHQLANITWAPPGTPELWSCDIIGNYPVSLQAMPDPRVDTHALLPLTLLPIAGYAQLACLIQAANVRSEPGSNPSKVYCAPPEGGVNFDSLIRCSVSTQRTFPTTLPASPRPGCPVRLMRESRSVPE